MSEILQSKSKDVPSSVMAKIADFVRPNSEYLKSGKPEVRAVTDVGWKPVGYAISVRPGTPDAYFDAHGDFLYSIPGVLEFEGGPDKSPLARDAMAMSRFSHSKDRGGKSVWRRGSNFHSGGSSESESVDPYSAEWLAAIAEISFQQDRLDIARRTYAKKAGLKVSVPPFSREDVEAFVKSRSITSKDLLELKRLSLVDAKTYEATKAEVAKSLATQLLDPRFAAALEKRRPDGSVTDIRPGWHGIDRQELETLVKEGAISSADKKAAGESLDLLERKSSELLRAMKGTKAALEKLKTETAHD